MSFQFTTLLNFKSNFVKITLSAIIATVFGGIILLFITPLFNLPKDNSKQLILQNTTTLIRWYKKIDNDFQAQKLAEQLYYGKYIKHKGKIFRIYPTHDNGIRLYFTNQVIAVFNKDSNAATLNNGDVITCIGRVERMGYFHIKLNDCSVIENHNIDK